MSPVWCSSKGKPNDNRVVIPNPPLILHLEEATATGHAEGCSLNNPGFRHNGCFQAKPIWPSQSHCSTIPSDLGMCQNIGTSTTCGLPSLSLKQPRKGHSQKKTSPFRWLVFLGVTRFWRFLWGNQEEPQAFWRVPPKKPRRAADFWEVSVQAFEAPRREDHGDKKEAQGSALHASQSLGAKANDKWRKGGRTNERADEQTEART